VIIMLHLIAIVILLLTQECENSNSIRCYGGKDGGKFQDCHIDFGFQTCFTKFENGVRVARGCSTKRPMLYVECEQHKSKNVLEEFCYCSYDLCNTSDGQSHSLSGSVLLIFVIMYTLTLLLNGS